MPLIPLLEEIYATGEMRTAAGAVRTPEPTGIKRDDALALAELVRGESLRTTLETGTAFGLSTLAIAGVHAERGEGLHISIDPTADTAFEGIAAANLRRAGLEEHVRLIGEGSELALPGLVEEGVRLDLAFIDGMHLFDYALVDFFYADRMLATGGYVAFHDTWMPAIQDAVDYVLTNRGYEHTQLAGPGMVILRKLRHDDRDWTEHRAFARRRRAPGPPEDEVRDLFARLRDGADEAARRNGGYRDHDLLLADQPVRLRFANEALEPAVLPAFGHARAQLEGDDRALTVLFWDSSSSDLESLEVPWGIGDVRLRGDVRGYEPGEYSVFYEHSSGAVTVFHRPSATMVFWIIDPRLSPWYERGAPLRSALHHWAAGLGMSFVHAGAVGVDGRGVLLAGASGSGKSTTALACLDAGMQYAGDDYVILASDGAPRVHCLYSTAKLDAPAIDRVPGLAAAVTDFQPGNEEKAVIDVHGHRPGLVVRNLAIDAVVIPSVGARRRPELRRTKSSHALRAIAPTTLLQLPGAARPRMAAMADLVRNVPAFQLELGSDVPAAVDAIADVCADPASAWSSAGPG